jgi:hypothetical protein
LKNLFIALLALQPAAKILFIPGKPEGGIIPKLLADGAAAGNSELEHELIGHHRYYGRAARP